MNVVASLRVRKPNSRTLATPVDGRLVGTVHDFRTQLTSLETSSLAEYGREANGAEPSRSNTPTEAP